MQTAGGGAEGEIVLRAVSDGRRIGAARGAGLAEPECRATCPSGGSVSAPCSPPPSRPRRSGCPAAGGRHGGRCSTNVLLGGDEGQPPDRPARRRRSGLHILVRSRWRRPRCSCRFSGRSSPSRASRWCATASGFRSAAACSRRRAASMPLARVHAVDVMESLLRRPFGLASVRVETAGYRSEAAAAQTLLPAGAAAPTCRRSWASSSRRWRRGRGSAAARAGRPPARAAATRSPCDCRRRRWGRARRDRARRLAGAAGAPRARGGVGPAAPPLGRLARRRTALVIRGGAVARRTLIARPTASRSTPSAPRSCSAARSWPTAGVGGFGPQRPCAAPGGRVAAGPVRAAATRGRQYRL